MQKKRLALVLCVLVALTALLGGCKPAGTSAGDNPAQDSRTITDVAGNTVTLKDVPERIVSLSPSTTEILFALGLKDKIVGRDASSDYPADCTQIAIVGDYNGPNVEAIVATQCDLVLASGTLQQDSIDQLKSLGIPVAAVEATSLAQIAETIAMIGTLTGTEEAAKVLQDSMAAAAQDVADAVKGKDTPTVYYVMSYGEYGNWTSGPGSFINDIIALAGGKPVTANASAAWLDYSLEQLVKDNPDYLLISSDIGDISLLAEAEGYKELDAVKNGHISSIDANISSRPGPRMMEAAALIAQVLHP